MAPQTARTAPMLHRKGITSPEQVTRDVFPGITRGTLGTYRSALRRAAEAGA